MPIANLTDQTEQLTALVQAGVQEQIFPGAAWAMGTSDHGVAGAAGRLTPEPGSAAMQVDTLFDIASLTKIISVWSLTGWLLRKNRLRLDSCLADVLPGTQGHALAPITIFQLILGLVIERLLDLSLDQALAEHVLRPLGMAATGFGPLAAAHGKQVAPTEYCEQAGAHLSGVTHDFSTRLLGGVCGISGLFSNVPDLQRFLQAMLAQDVQGEVLDANWVRASLTVQTGSLTPSRGLFWHPAAGTGPEDDVWCHLGFTGTAMWISPRRGRYAVLLTNKLYYTRDFTRINDIRRDFMRGAFAL